MTDGIGEVVQLIYTHQIYQFFVFFGLLLGFWLIKKLVFD